MFQYRYAGILFIAKMEVIENAYYIEAVGSGYLADLHL